MKFIDEVIITVQSGDGGSGCVSFRREKFIPRGGPDGGDGGKGGDVVVKSTSRKRTLYHFQYKKHFKAQKGRNGQGNQKTGKDGEELSIEVPPGTLVTDIHTGKILKDFINSDESFIVAKAGRGGQGNKRFATSTHRTPRFAQPGEPGQTLTIKLELKLLADVGNVGLPNAGKSTLISAVSSARPKIADYPFTTLTPCLGVVQAGKGRTFVVADIPGLIEGAHQGVGLGIRFLRHIERTRVLVHLIDASTIDLKDPLDAYRTINQELIKYGESLGKKPQIVVLSKLDLPGAEQAAQVFKSAVKGVTVASISAVTGKGLKDLISQIAKFLGTFHE